MRIFRRFLAACLLAASTAACAVNIAYPLNLAAGWNLAGNGRAAPLDVKTLFAAAAGVTSVWAWDAAAGRWGFYAPALDGNGTLASYAATKGYSVLTTLNAGQGFWVNAAAPLSLGSISGTGFALAASDLKPGWNLSATGEDVAPDAFAVAVGNVHTLWAWDNPSGRWYFYAPTLAASGSLPAYAASNGYKAFGPLRLGNGLGFWVNRAAAGASAGAAAGYTLMAWNDLGMHCVDGKDYSVFSILPPYNNLHAQLVDKASGKLVSSGVSLSYEALADPAGAINTGSVGKTNFWDWVKRLFGVELPPDVGLTGNATPSATPRPMRFDAANGWFEASGIPITPYDDGAAATKNYYPMVKVVARDAAGTVLATARTVLPVSDEMSCRACHASGAGSAARPAAGWINDSDVERDWKRNILRLHDEKRLASAVFQAALAQFGYRADGLLATAQAGQPILCAACHASNALSTSGAAGVGALTRAMHSGHAAVADPSAAPASGLTLDSSDNRSACYLCHPGSLTKCLRGAMGQAVDAAGNMRMGCQSCHGNMSSVGSASRVGWLHEPNCQSCHHDGLRETSAVDSAGVLRAVGDTRFMTNPDTPAAGLSLYRFSKGHGQLQCEACHGATHAEYPSADLNDNLLSIDIQGHAGTLRECASCHATPPLTASGGPHGMHTIGPAWVGAHEQVVESAGSQACAYCHGADYRGGFLSEVKLARTFSVEGKTRSYRAGERVGCYDCHDGPHGD